MKRTEIRAFVILLLAALSAWSTPNLAAEHELIAAADFGALPFMVGPKMSPDAKHVATTAHVNGKKLLVILALGAAKSGPTRSFTMPRFSVRRVRWRVRRSSGRRS